MDPITIAAAVAAAGKLFSGLTSWFAGSQQKKLLNQQANQVRIESGIASSIKMEEGDRIGAQAATRAAAGGGGLTGSAIGVLQDLERQSMFNARVAIYEGVTRGRMLDYEGRVAQQDGVNKLIKSGFDAAQTFLGGKAEASQQTQFRTPPPTDAPKINLKGLY